MGFTRRLQSVKLGEVCRVINGRAYKQDELLDKGKYPVMRVGNFFSNRSWYYSDLELDEDKYCDNGDLLYAWSASFGPKIWDGEKCIYHYHIWKMVPDEERINKQFLYHILNRETESIKAEGGRGIAMIHITKGGIEAREIPLPPISIQEEIVAEIEGYQKIIDGAKAIVTHYKPKIAIDPDWELVELGGLAKNLDGKRVPITKADRDEGKYPYYGASGIVDYVADFIFDEDLLLISEDGANLIARVTPIAFSVSGKVWVNNHAHVLRFEEMATQKFVEYYLNSISLEPYITGSAQPKLNQKSLNSITIPLPDIETQRQIVAQIEKEQALVNANKQLIEIFEQKIKDRIAKVWGSSTSSVQDKKTEEATLSRAAEPATEYLKN
jgi:restriction endonuclease S subunit